jgi:plasmid stabilization system protein ParE
MSLPVVSRLQALEDLDAIHTSYDEVRPGLGDDFVAKVRDVRTRIGNHPHLYGLVGGRVRGAPVRRFPYVVYYIVEPARVVIIAILHVRQSRRDLRGRI